VIDHAWTIEGIHREDYGGDKKRPLPQGGFSGQATGLAGLGPQGSTTTDQWWCIGLQGVPLCAIGASQLGRMGSMVPKVFGKVLERFPSFGVFRVEMVPRLSDSFWAFGQLSIRGLSVDFGVHLVKMTYDGYFINSIESKMLFTL
ncbi:hypothetical protein HAX54_014554, partial [Datura stramonium]|nr:hypothetical protein [Datura stramonium]